MIFSRNAKGPRLETRAFLSRRSYRWASMFIYAFYAVGSQLPTVTRYRT